MRGYEPSSIPNDNDFTAASIAGDVLAWLDQLGIKQVHLVGHDWGAVAAYAAASVAPHRFLSITTIAIPHPQRFIREGLLNIPSQLLNSWYMLFNQIPRISDYFSQRNDFAFMRYLWSKWSPSYESPKDQWEQLTENFSKPGVIKSMLSYYRQNVSIGQILRIKKSIENEKMLIDVPNLCITGSQDGCVDTRLFDHTILAEDHPKGFRVERIEGAGHFVHLEKPQLVNKLLIDWFATNGSTDESTRGSA